MLKVFLKVASKRSTQKKSRNMRWMWTPACLEWLACTCAHWINSLHDKFRNLEALICAHSNLQHACRSVRPRKGFWGGRPVFAFIVSDKMVIVHWEFLRKSVFRCYSYYNFQVKSLKIVSKTSENLRLDNIKSETFLSDTF